MTIDNERAGNQNVKNREDEDSKLVQQMTNFLFFAISVVVVNIIPVDRIMCKDEDNLKHTEANNSFCHSTHGIFGMKVLVTEPSVYAAHKKNVKTYKDEQQAL